MSAPESYSLRTYKLGREVVEADVVINVPKLKVHQQMQLTAAIKNNFGCVPGKRKARLHFSRGQDRITFGKMLIEYSQLIKPALTVIDAITAMHKLGPRSWRSLSARCCDRRSGCGCAGSCACGPYRFT